MRGKRSQPRHSAGGLRLIPAHAGKTPKHAGRHSLVGAHPRACGENIDVSVIVPVKTGSSPRMRGKQPEWTAYYRSEGLIPAHAGKTGYVYDRPRRGKAHPRACGENGIDTTTALGKMGSSPRMRGKRLLTSSMRRLAGLIPAHAGKTLPKPPIHGRRRAHPRACGENLLSIAVPFSFNGSSPRMRGKRRRAVEGHESGRLIPAHAGKTP